jgi:lysophospholipase L1-like esterase
MEIRSYVALGDSFTEGLDDPTAVGGGYRADCFAEHPPAPTEPVLRQPGRARKTLGQIVDEQVPQAIAFRPDLVSLAAGGGDMLRPGSDPTPWLSPSMR